MKRLPTIWALTIILMVFCPGLSEAQPYVLFADGEIHTVDWPIVNSVWVRNGPLNQPTTLNLMPGGRITVYLYVWDSSQVNMLGGSISSDLDAYDSSQVNMSSGSIGSWLTASGSNQINISGGSISGGLGVGDTSQWYMSGGSIGGELVVYNCGILTIEGWDFRVDDQPFGYGELTRSLSE